MKIEKKESEMSDQPTPETDAAWRLPISFDSNEKVVHISVAQTLERERGEARDTIADVLRALEAIEHEGPRLAAMRVKSERDEARDDAAHWKTEYEIVVARLRGRKHPRDNGILLKDEIIPKLERERDEARDALKASAELLCFFFEKAGITRKDLEERLESAK